MSLGSSWFVETARYFVIFGLAPRHTRLTPLEMWITTLHTTIETEVLQLGGQGGPPDIIITMPRERSETEK